MLIRSSENSIQSVLHKLTQFSNFFYIQSETQYVPNLCLYRLTAPSADSLVHYTGGKNHPEKHVFYIYSVFADDLSNVLCIASTCRVVVH